MAQEILSRDDPGWENFLAADVRYEKADWTMQELCSRIEWNFSHRPCWSMIEEADEEVKSFILLTLKEYSLLWNPPEILSHVDPEGSNASDEFDPFDIPKMIQLYTAAELDFERGLKLISELELTHPIPLRARTKWRFDAIMALCAECRQKTGMMDSDRESDSDSEADGTAYVYVQDMDPDKQLDALANHDFQRDMAKVSNIYGQVARQFEARLRTLLTQYSGGSAADDEDTLRAKAAKAKKNAMERERKKRRKQQSKDAENDKAEGSTE